MGQELFRSELIVLSRQLQKRQKDDNQLIMMRQVSAWTHVGWCHGAESILFSEARDTLAIFCILFDYQPGHRRQECSHAMWVELCADIRGVMGNQLRVPHRGLGLSICVNDRMASTTISCQPKCDNLQESPILFS